MGQSVSSRRSSVPSLRERSTVLRSSRKRMPKLRRGNGRDLSEAFNLITDNFHVDLLDINSATEEQLMTLPGISRRTAQNIIEYRIAIGHFKKIEDLAIVSGVGASKLAAIRSEISVSCRRKGLSRSSSCGTPSDDSLALNTTKSEVDSRLKTSNGVSVASDQNYFGTSYSSRLLDLNGASMFQLMSIRGISQEMAANIVHYREKKGRFKVVDDLIKVRGFNGRVLGEFKLYLTVNHRECGARKGRTHRRSSSVPPTSHLKSVLERSVDETTSGEIDPSNLSSKDNTELYELLASRCPRPIAAEAFAFRRNERAALRIATWNLDRFDDEKSRNLGVIEVICLTILESGVSLIALQELANRQVLEKVRQELKNPSLKKIQEWVGPRGAWEFLVSEPVGSFNEQEHLGFLYDRNRGIVPLHSETLVFPQPNNNEPTIPGAFFAKFRMDGFELSILCVHLPRSNDKEAHIRANGRLVLENGIASGSSSMEAIFDTWPQKLKDASLLLVVGDFNSDPSSKELKIVGDHLLTGLVPSGISTAASCSNSDTSALSTFKDNIFINVAVKSYFTGHWDVVRSGLSHLAIPKGWTWGGNASCHCPIWAEFYATSTTKTLDKDSPKGVSTANGTTVHDTNGSTFL